MDIRKAQQGDALGVAEVQVDTWHSTYSPIVPESYLQRMTYAGREKKWRKIIAAEQVYVAAVPAEGIVGFIHGGQERSGLYAGFNQEVYALYIRKEHQGKGLGTRLLDAWRTGLLHRDASVLVRVLEDNPACAFYEKKGAERIDSQTVTIDGVDLEEAVYGWGDIRQVDF
ncbi:GNAT family N-acetyltransferase [Halobacillus sp. ACCC02827]|uniref:GNAT family N-acetyltransferase n=1 Tax=Halobacillus sp. ACCC02827 TaxID=3052090 RepID=UPI00256FB189|nr:GNAT family N-acetyltransferase [Halobacillus sp. ACCC02827]WJE16996.1 GNAT family N-acetyltransferase [Halobacillus sp. ACCC02827]